MSNFLKEIKQTFSNPKQELDETSKAILDIENKKKAIIQASNNEQNSLLEKISHEYKNIGETSYKLHTDGVFDIEKITDMFNMVTELYQTLNEKQTKLNEILNRYDEELNILRPQPKGQAVCSNCGAAYIPGEMLFCSGCGNKLQVDEPPVNESIQEPASQIKCINCNAENIMDSVFCASCGSKI